MAGVEIYRKFRKHVGTSRGLGIPDEDTHQARLRLAAAMLNRHGAASLFDVGCGYGDLRMHVLRCSYFGIDAHPWMIEEARRRLPATPFETMSLECFPPDPARFDAVAALGVLVTVAPDCVAATVALLARQAGRLLALSFIRDGAGYKGAFNAYPTELVVGRWPVLESGDLSSERTVLLDIRR